MTSSLKTIIYDIKDTAFGFMLILAFFAMIFSSIAYFFSSWYYPLRLAQTGEMTSVVVLSTDDTTSGGKVGTNWLRYIAVIQGYDKKFSVVPSLYDGLQVGQTYTAFYSSEIKYGVITNEKLNWLECIYYDSIHAPLLGLGMFCLVSFLFVRRVLRLLLNELREIIDKSVEKFGSEEDALLKNLSITGAIVPYGVVFIFVYVIGLLSIYTIFSIEDGSSFRAGIVGGLAVIMMAYSPAALFKIRRVLADLRIVRVIASMIKLSLSAIALWRLFSFVSTNTFSDEDSVRSLLWSLFKYIIGM